MYTRSRRYGREEARRGLRGTIIGITSARKDIVFSQAQSSMCANGKGCRRFGCLHLDVATPVEVETAIVRAKGVWSLKTTLAVDVGEIVSCMNVPSGVGRRL